MTRLEALEAVAREARIWADSWGSSSGTDLRAALAALDAVPVEGPCPMCRICGHTRGSHADGAGECEDAVGEATECQCPVYVPTHPVSCPRCNGTGRTK